MLSVDQLQRVDLLSWPTCTVLGVALVRGHRACSGALVHCHTIQLTNQVSDELFLVISLIIKLALFMLP